MKTTKKLVSFKEMSPLITGLIEEGVDVTILVTGNSMRPMLTGNKDTVVLTKCDAESLKKGDIPLYKRDNGRYILHRIVKVHENTYDLAGDFQTEVERNVPKENVLCVVKAFTKNGKQHACDEKRYKLYTKIWCFVLPLRSFLMSVYRLRYIFKKKK